MAGNSNSGRPGKPAIVHMINGNKSKKSTKDLQDEINNPPMPVEAPDKPDWLDTDAAREWDVLVPDMLKMGMISRLDGQSLAQYCEAVCEYRRFTLLIREFNTSTISPRGGDVQTYRTGAKDLSIWRKLRNDAQRRADELGRQFGFTPLSRRGLKPQAPQGELFPYEQKDIVQKYF